MNTQKTQQNRHNTTRDRLKYLIKIAILAGLATVLMMLEIPLPFTPPFYKLDFSEVPVLIGSFALGPVAGVLIEALKILLKLATRGTETAFVGELANFLVGCTFLLPAAIIYRSRKKLSGAIWGMVIGTLTFTVAGSLMNAFVLIPAYVKLFKMPLDSIIDLGSKANVLVHDLPTLIAFAVAPFNLVKGLAASLITTLLYKRVSPLLHK